MNEIVVRASPNIAFIKYWGKKPSSRDEERNLALNPSLSLSLSKAQTEVRLSPANKREFFIQGQAATDLDQEKLLSHVDRVQKYLLDRHGKKEFPSFRMDSINNFPTGTGIASSASAYAALTCAFLGWALGPETAQKLLVADPQGLADLARRGSGSACRSLHGPFVKWTEQNIEVISSSWKLYDTIVIFSRKEKIVSSSEGHRHAPLSPLFSDRLSRLPSRISSIERALRKRNLEALGPLIEEEADEMHSIMRENPHPIDYQLPATKRFLNKLREIRRDFYYTLDAGPNVHLISEKPIRHIIDSLLLELELNAEVWEDETGYGPSFQ